MNERHWLVEFFRWDAKAVLAVVLGLAVLIGLALAAAEGNLVANFDFGGASLADKAPNMIQVKGSLSVYPQVSGNLKFGWMTAGTSEFSNKSVADLMKRDYNSGADNSEFRISGLDKGAYQLKATVGSPSGSLSTRIRVGDLATTVTVATGSWQVMNLTVSLETDDLNILFSSANGTDPWGVCGLAIYQAGNLPQASFAVTVSPAQQTIAIGNTAVFSVGVTPVNSYASKVTAQIAGLAAGMTAEFVPAELTVPPGVMELRIYTTKATPVGTYTLLVTVKGNDAVATQQTVSLSLDIASGAGVPPSSESNVILPTRTPGETKQDFNKVDAFVAEQRAKALQHDNFLDMAAIGDALANVGIFEQLPTPKTTTEAILQKLVGAGIISSTTDSAPQVSTAPAPGFWRSLWQSVFKPAS